MKMHFRFNYEILMSIFMMYLKKNKIIYKNKITQILILINNILINKG